MKHKGNYIFTNRRHPKKGIMATILGAVSIISIIIAIYLTFLQRGVAAFNYGIVVLLSTLFSLGGLWLGVVSKMEKESFYLFPYLGIALNLIALVISSVILYAGAYGI